MATNCEDVSAQMMELLYGELPADARASVNAHVAGCARCRSELEGFEKTRTLARQGLDEAPPARARAAILAAAAAHLAAQAQPTAARKPAVPEKVSFWDRLRTRWAFPTLATVGAVAVFLVANRVFLNPERTLERSTDERSTAPAQAPAAAPAVTPAPPVPEISPMAEPAAAADSAPAPRGEHAHARAAATVGGDQKPSRGKGRADDYRGGFDKDIAGTGERRDAPTLEKAEGAARRFAAPPPPATKPATAPAKTLRDQPATGGQFAPPPPPREDHAAKQAKGADKAQPAREAPQELDREISRSSSSRRPTVAEAPAKHKAPIDDLVGDEAAAKSSTAPGGGGLGAVGSAAGPRNKADGHGAGYGSGVAQAAPAPAPAQPAPARNQPAKRPAPAPAAAPAPVVASSPAPPAQGRAKSEVDEDYAAPQESEAKSEKKKASGKASANTSETLKQRADRLFAEGRWAEAVVAYRELLRRDPGNDDAERWRRRMAVAENADVSERNASLARRKAAPPAASAKPPAKAADKAPSKAASSDSSE